VNTDWTVKAASITRTAVSQALGSPSERGGWTTYSPGNLTAAEDISYLIANNKVQLTKLLGDERKQIGLSRLRDELKAEYKEEITKGQRDALTKEECENALRRVEDEIASIREKKYEAVALAKQKLKKKKMKAGNGTGAGEKHEILEQKGKKRAREVGAKTANDDGGKRKRTT
jgi:hypothetical protein